MIPLSMPPPAAGAAAGGGAYMGAAAGGGAWCIGAAAGGACALGAAAIGLGTVDCGIDGAEGGGGACFTTGRETPVRREGGIAQSNKLERDAEVMLSATFIAALVHSRQKGTSAPAFQNDA